MSSTSAVTEYAPSSRRIVLATASGSGAGSRAMSAAITSESEPEPSRTPSCDQLRAQLLDVHEVAVVPERDRALAPVVDQRLRVRPAVRAGRRVARVPDRDLTRQRLQLLLVEDLRDETHVAHDREPAAVGDGDPGRLLTSMLEREQAEVREPRHVSLLRADAEDAAHQ